MRELNLISIFFLSLNLVLAQEHKLDLESVHFRNSNHRDTPTRTEWIDMDIEKIEQVYNIIPLIGSSLESLEQYIPNVYASFHLNNSNVDLGNDLILLRIRFSGGYTTFFVDVLTWNKQVLKINQYFTPYKDLFVDHYQNKLSIPITVKYGYIETETRYKENIDKYKKAHPKVLIEPKVKDLDSATAMAYQYFMSYQFARSDIFSAMHTSSRYWIPATHHISHIINTQQYKLLDSMLESIIPCTRVLAASALKYLEKTGEYYRPENTEKIALILSEETTIQSGILSCWVGRFTYDEIDPNSDFKGLILERNAVRIALRMNDEQWLKFQEEQNLIKP